MARNYQTVAEFLARAIDLSGKTQREIAQEIGYPKPNVVSMMKQGMTKIPVDKIPDLAKALGVDPALMIQVAMREYQPDLWSILVGTLGESLSDDEKALLSIYREERNRNPALLQQMTDVSLEESFRGIFHPEPEVSKTTADATKVIEEAS